jgi:hypothetical protein
MMNMRKLVVLTCFVLSFCPGVNAQNDCDKQFKKALDKVKSMRLMSVKGSFEMNCLIVVTGVNGDVRKENLTVNARGEKYKYKSSQFDLYQDGKTMVVIQHERKAVFLTQPMPEQRRSNQFAELVALQDSLQRYMTLSHCEQEFGTIVPGEGLFKMTFLPDKKIESAGLKSITYWISAATHDIRKMVMDYDGKSIYGIKKYEMTVLKMNLNSTTIPFQGEALAMAVERNKLKEALKGYQVIDKRQNSKSVK